VFSILLVAWYSIDEIEIVLRSKWWAVRFPIAALSRQEPVPLNNMLVT